MAGNVPPTMLFKDIRSLDRKSHTAYIEVMSTALQSLGVPACVFQPETYLLRGYTESLFAQRLRPLQNYNDSVKLERVLQIGIHHHHFDSYRSASGEQFYHFLEFLRTPAGQNALSLVAQQDRLARRGGEHFTAEEMSWIAMFEAHRNDLNGLLDDVRSEHKEVIDDLELQLREARHQLKTDLTQIKQNHLPASLYTPLSDVDFNKACWSEYTIERRRQKQLPVVVSHSSSRDAELKFGDQFKQQHIVDFLDVGNRMQQLQDYIDRRSAN